ncbi:gamma-tubulin complex component 2 [Paragonimus westermani]|uniref:Gamma-tubulin complex component n=1 Tax=Paragonimus westermani TaxID=34504 RepID=A0A5J4NE85_9TREM|nr:gamma-tubulin complex component 2 [Paragonimus westermani]
MDNSLRKACESPRWLLARRLAQIILNCVSASSPDTLYSFGILDVGFGDNQEYHPSSCVCTFQAFWIKRDADLASALERVSESKLTDLGQGDSSENTLTRKGVQQLQQLIADSNTQFCNTSHSINSDRTLRSLFAGSVDAGGVGPPYSDTSIRTESRFADDQSVTAGRTRLINLRTNVDEINNVPVQERVEGSTAASGAYRLPHQPDWLYERTNLWNDFLPIVDIDTNSNYLKAPIESLSNEMQEHAVVGDLLRLLQGNQGVYIKPAPLISRMASRTFHLDENMKKSLFEYGMVNHALSGAMRRLLKDYYVLLCQLEHEYRTGRLGIARLQFSLQASVPFFTILQKWIYRGVISDPYHEFFISAGSMSDFFPHGHVASDRHLAPMERMNHDAVDWAYFWEQYHTIVSHNVPSFLESHLSQILNTGKYLNVVQQCADAYELPSLETLEYDDVDPTYLEQIERAHLYASSLLLKLMIKEKDLKEHLISIKRYFLLDQADFIVHFMDAAASELHKPSTDVSLLRLSSLLESAIRTSTATLDPFKDNLKVVIYKFDLITQILMVLRAGSDLEMESTVADDMDLTGLEAFSVDYSVGWPISLVLNRQVMDRYQMLFRHMFYCKHVERRLCSSWVLGKVARRADCLIETWFTTAFLLGQRMLTFIQHFQYYMAVEVIEPTWDQFFQQMDKVSNLDALLDAHLYCLEVCMDDCLLACPDLLSLFGKLAVVCVLFANFVQRVLSASAAGLGMDSALPADIRHTRGPHLHDPIPGPWTYDNPASKRPSSQLSYAASTVSGDSVLTKVTRDDFNQFGASEAFAQSVIDFDRKFNSLLVEFVEKLKHYAKERNKLSSLVSRLDFNDFYSTTFLADNTPTSDLSNRLTFEPRSIVTDMTTEENTRPVPNPRGHRVVRSTYHPTEDFGDGDYI